jgi:hypothetical protein
VIAGGSQQALVLDAGLRERARFDQGLTQLDWSDALLIDDRYAIIERALRHTPRDYTYQLAVFDGVARVQHQLLPHELSAMAFSYEPSTGLLAASAGSGPLLFRLDPTSHEFGEPIAISSWLPPARVAVLDPRQSGGVAALTVDNASDGVLVAEFPLADMEPGATLAARTSYRVPGELRAVDRAGRLYMRGTGEEIAVYRRGAVVARLPALAGMALYPNADGSLIAAVQSPRVVLLTATGQVRWEAALWNSADLAWTASGELLVRHLSGVARVDLATGSLATRRCGWSFGISDSPFEMAQTGPSLCEVAR